MKRVSFYLIFLLGLFLSMGVFILQELTEPAPVQAIVFAARSQPPLLKAQVKNIHQSQGSEQENEAVAVSPLEWIQQLSQNTEQLPGLFTLYRQKETGKVYLEIKPEQLNKNYIATITLASGIGEGDLFSGQPLQDFLFYFRRVNNTVQFAIRNVNFRTRPGDPQARSLERSFSDSVLYSLEIKAIHPQRQTIFVDLGELLLNDVPDLSSLLKESLQAQYQLDEKKSYFSEVQAFPLNLEIDAVYGFSFLGDEGDRLNLLTLPDRRAITLKVHYSFSELPENNGYRPRLADDRVGYFYTAYQDFSDNNRRDPVVRYINRWHLEKQDPNAPLSPPKKPIVFWIENTVPLEYRDAIREGVLLWNQAFEKAGFKNAIEVQQMPDKATWNPADIRYNTIRWLTSEYSSFVGLGPQRVNPLTGEVLDADLILDADFARSLKSEYRALVQLNPSERNDSNQLGEFLHQYILYLTAHEVGHTLGLRHNFRGSTLLKPEELNDTNITRTRGMVSSVMDYVPINLAPPGTPQGDYFPVRVGAYDEWAIEYGYKPSGAVTPQAEKRFLEQIAQKQANSPELSYATDEESADLDPTANAEDLSSDPLRYSLWQLDRARILWDRLKQRYPTTGESYSELTELFDTVFGYYWQNLGIIAKYIGGQSFYRDRPVIGKGRLPFEPVPVEKQRQALAALQKYIFAEDALNFPPELLNRLAPSPWFERGYALSGRLDYPIHDSIFSPQSSLLRDLLSGDRLSRLRDLELKTQPGQALTMPELFNTLQAGIWTELLQSDDKPVKISSLRRALQREHLQILVNMVLRTEEDVPEDARTLAWAKLRQLRQEINQALRKRGRQMDDYSKAHLEATGDRITKVLDAPLQSKSNRKRQI